MKFEIGFSYKITNSKNQKVFVFWLSSNRHDLITFTSAN